MQLGGHARNFLILSTCRAILFFFYKYNVQILYRKTVLACIGLISFRLIPLLRLVGPSFVQKNSMQSKLNIISYIVNQCCNMLATTTSSSFTIALRTHHTSKWHRSWIITCILKRRSTMKAWKDNNFLACRIKLNHHDMVILKQSIAFFFMFYCSSSKSSFCRFYQIL